MNTEAQWTIIGVIVGSILSLGFNELSQYFRYRGERRRISNKVIYSLLNIRYELLKLNNEKNLDSVLDTMERTIGEKIPDYDREAVKQQIGNTSNALMEDSVYDNLEEIGDQFKGIITTFAEIDPKGAYRLNDSSKFLVVHDFFQDYLENVKLNFGETISPELFPKFELCLKTKNILESTNTLKEEIIKLSEKTTRKIDKDVQLILNRQDKPSPLTEDFDECIKLLFTHNN